MSEARERRRLNPGRVMGTALEMDRLNEPKPKLTAVEGTEWRYFLDRRNPRYAGLAIPDMDALAQRVVRHVSGDDWAAMTDGERNNYRSAVREVLAAGDRPAGAGVKPGSVQN
jgi:hypothetical protein